MYNIPSCRVQLLCADAQQFGIERSEYPHRKVPDFFGRFVAGWPLIPWPCRFTKTSVGRQ